MTKIFWWLLSNCAIIVFLLHVVNDPNILCWYFVYMHLHQGHYVTFSQTEQRRRSASQIQAVRELIWSKYDSQTHTCTETLTYIFSDCQTPHTDIQKFFLSVHRHVWIAGSIRCSCKVFRSVSHLW